MIFIPQVRNSIEKNYIAILIRTQVDKRTTNQHEQSQFNMNRCLFKSKEHCIKSP